VPAVDHAPDAAKAAQQHVHERLEHRCTRPHRSQATGLRNPYGDRCHIRSRSCESVVQGVCRFQSCTWGSAVRL
jgi:hypothetical protein